MAAATMIIKGILGGIGGGLQGAGKGSQTTDINGDTNHAAEFQQLGYDVGNQGMDKMKEKINAKLAKAMNGGQGGAGGGAGGDKSGADNASGAEASEGAEAAEAAEASEAADAASAMSDILLKSVYGDSLDDKIIDNFAKISAISFKYNEDAKSKYGEEVAVDDNAHVGVIAQELRDNPVTEGSVKENENGDLEVDTRHLTFADTAAIGELSRRVLALETVVKELQNKIQ